MLVPILWPRFRVGEMDVPAVADIDGAAASSDKFMIVFVIEIRVKVYLVHMIVRTHGDRLAAYCGEAVVVAAAAAPGRFRAADDFVHMPLRLAAALCTADNRFPKLHKVSILR